MPLHKTDCPKIQRYDVQSYSALFPSLILSPVYFCFSNKQRSMYYLGSPEMITSQVWIETNTHLFYGVEFLCCSELRRLQAFSCADHWESTRTAIPKLEWQYLITHLNLPPSKHKWHFVFRHDFPIYNFENKCLERVYFKKFSISLSFYFLEK